MRYLAAVLFVAHGLAHLAGATTMRRSVWEGTVWAALALGWVVVAAGVLLRGSWWLVGVELVAGLSLVFCLWRWQEAKFGVAVNVLALGLAFAYLAYPGGDGVGLRDAHVERLWGGQGPALRLRMRGEIRLGKAWYPFRAEQVLTGRDEFVWAATVSMWGLPIVGRDEYVGGEGAMRWKLFGLIPVAVAEGADVSKSAMGRMKAEQAIWLEAKREVAERQMQFWRWGNPEGKEFREEVFGVLFEETRSFGAYTIPSKIRAGWYFGTPKFETEGEFFRATVEGAEWK